MEAAMQLLSSVTFESLTAVYGSGFILTFAAYAVGLKVGIVVRSVNYERGESWLIFSVR